MHIPRAGCGSWLIKRSVACQITFLLLMRRLIIPLLFRAVFPALWALTLFSSTAGMAAESGTLPLPTRTQVIELQQGWNAVWLEVSPLDAAPEKVFGGTPIDLCARYFRPVTATQFIKDPAEAPWNEEGWGVWYAPDREDAVLKSLHRIDGCTGYLIHATAALKWKISGTVSHHEYRWKTESYNLAGFSVDEQNPPMFGKFFEGSGGKVGSMVYRLIEGRWQRIENLGGTKMRSGEACWIFAKGDASYQGPLSVDLGGLSAADFGTLVDTIPLTCVNASSSLKTVTAQLTTATGGATLRLPLRWVTPDIPALTVATRSAATPSTLSLAAGVAGKFRLQVRRNEMSASAQAALVRLSDGAGACVWVPVRAQK